MQKNKISVIVPIHNTREYVTECINSILNQSYRNIELLCMDSSTDNTSNIVAGLSHQDDRIIHIYDENSSYGYKVNRGILMATGEYIAIVDSDDYIQKNMFESLMEHIEAVDFVKCDYCEFYVNKGVNIQYRYQMATFEYLYNKKINVREYPELLYRNSIGIWSCIYKKSFLDKNKINMNESGGASFQDLGFATLTHVFAENCYYVNKGFYYYRIDNINSSVKSNSKIGEIIGECEWIENRLQDVLQTNNILNDAWQKKKLISYLWNYSRLDLCGKCKFTWLSKELILKEFYELEKIDLQEEMIGVFQEMHLKAEEMKKIETKILRHDKIDDNNILISIIVPVYNTYPYILDCISSITNQGFEDIEVICINDASTDDSEILLHELSCIDQRILVINNEQNRGLAFTRNVGIAAAKGKYLLFIDSDDLYKQNTLVDTYTIAENNRCDIVYFDAECFFEEGVPYSSAKVEYYTHYKAYGKKSGKQLLDEMTANNKFTDSACLMLINREWLNKAGIKFYNGIIYEDCLFTVQCMIKAEVVVHKNEKYYQYRVRKNSILTSNQDRAINMYSRAVIYREFMKMYQDESFEGTQFQGLLRMIHFVRENIRNMSYRISPEELKKLSDFELDAGVSLALEMSDVSIEKIYDKNILEKIKEAQSIELYGAGVRCKRFIEYLMLTGQGDKISNIIVSSGAGQAESLCGIPIRAIDLQYKPEYDSLIVVTMAGEAAVQVANLLKEKEYANIAIIDKNTNELIVDEIRKQLKV